MLTQENEFKAANVKVHVDPYSHYRQQELLASIDFSQLSRNERVANQWDMSYKNLGADGNIGLVSNGVGTCLAMMDLLTAMGGKPANFLDLGGQVIHE